MAANPRFYVRPEHNQWDFVRQSARAFDGAIIPARYLSSYSEGHPSFEKPATRLATAVRDVDREVIVDPGTPALVSRSVATEPKAARLRMTPAANAVDLPLTSEYLDDPGRCRRFVDASLEGQAVSRRKTPPYLDFATTGGSAFQLNLQMYRRSVAVAGPERALAFVQVRYSRLLAGVLAEAAPLIADCGVTQVVLRVRGFGEFSSPQELDAYLYALTAFLECGIEVIVDCVGRLGPVFTHRGASGFSSGSMFFRSVPRDLLVAGGGGGGAALRYEVDGAWDWIDRSELSIDTRCPVEGCTVKPGARLDEIREHNLHLLRHRGTVAAQSSTSDFVASLRGSGNPFAAGWAATLGGASGWTPAAGSEGQPRT